MYIKPGTLNREFSSIIFTSRKKHFFRMKGDVGMAGVQIMKKEVNKTTTTTNTSYSIPTSFVGTAYPWVHVKDVGMEYDVFVVVVVLLTSFFIICTPAIPTSPFISKKCFFLLVPPIFLCTRVWQMCDI